MIKAQIDFQLKQENVKIFIGINNKGEIVREDALRIYNPIDCFTQQIEYLEKSENGAHFYYGKNSGCNFISAQQYDKILTKWLNILKMIKENF